MCTQKEGSGCFLMWMSTSVLGVQAKDSHEELKVSRPEPQGQSPRKGWGRQQGRGRAYSLRAPFVGSRFEASSCLSVTSLWSMLRWGMPVVPGWAPLDNGWGANSSGRLLLPLPATQTPLLAYCVSLPKTLLQSCGHILASPHEWQGEPRQETWSHLSRRLK